MPDSVIYASIMSVPPKAILVVKMSSVATNSTNSPAGETTLIPHSPIVATQMLPDASIPSESKNLYPAGRYSGMPGPPGPASAATSAAQASGASSSTDDAYIRVAHLVPGFGGVTMTATLTAFDGSTRQLTLAPEATYGAITGYEPLPAGSYAVAVRPGGSRVYVGTAQGIALVDPGTNAVVTTVFPPSLNGVLAVDGLAVNPAGTRLYAARPFIFPTGSGGVPTPLPGSLSVLDTATNVEIATLTGVLNPARTTVPA